MGTRIRIGSAVLAMGLAFVFGSASAVEAAVVRARGTMTIDQGKKSVTVNGKRFLIVKKTKVSLDDRKVIGKKLRKGMMVRVKGRGSIGAKTMVADAIRAQDEVQGRIAAMNAAGNPPSFTILNQNVFVDDLTIFANMPAGMAVGQFVEVHGFRDEAFNIRASRVELKFGVGETETETAEFKGSIGAFDGVAKTFSIGTQAVNFSAATVTPAGATLATGMPVEVRGNLDGLGVLQATGVDREDLEDEAFEPHDRQKARIEGYVSGLVANADGVTFSFSIDNNAIATLPNTQFRRGAVGDLADGVLAEVEGVQSGAVFVAREVSFERNRIRLEGAATAAAAGSVSLLGLTVEIDALTDQRNVPVVGSRFQVRGFKDKLGALIAEEVRATNDERDHLQGPVDAITGNSVTILGMTINLSGATFQNDLDQPMSSGQFFGTVRAGALVKVRLNAGTLVADEAEIER